MFIPLHCGFIIHERLTYAPHWCCNRWNCRIFSTGCGCYELHPKPIHCQNPIRIQKIGNINENRIFYKKTMPTVTNWHRFFCFKSCLFPCTMASSFMNVWLTHHIGATTVGIVAFFSWLRLLRMATQTDALPESDWNT